MGRAGKATGSDRDSWTQMPAHLPARHFSVNPEHMF
jgi:hypothetical protein